MERIEKNLSKPLSSTTNSKHQLINCKNKKQTNKQFGTLHINNEDLNFKKENDFSKEQESEIINMNATVKLENQKYVEYCDELEENYPSRRKSPKLKSSNFDTNDRVNSATVKLEPKIEPMSEDHSQTNDGGALTSIHIKAEPELNIFEEIEDGMVKVEFLEDQDANLSFDEELEGSDDPLSDSDDSFTVVSQK